MSKRLTKDLESIQKNYKEIFTVNLCNGDLKLWHISFTGASDSIYNGEKFTYFFFNDPLTYIPSLQFRFSPEYVRKRVIF